MNINSRFAVAIHLLTALADKRDEPLTSEYLAGSVTTNPVVIRRALGELRRAGLVASQSGHHGGWRLTRTPNQITLRDAYKAVQRESLFALPPAEPNPHCDIGRSICTTMRGIFEEAEEAMLCRLQGHTLADVLARVQECKR